VSLGLRRCWDLTEAQLTDAMLSRQAAGQLLREMASIALPNTGAAKILIVVARLARPECEWIDGTLRVEVEAVGDKTRVAVMEDLGGGARELVFPRLVMNAPLDEFQRSVRVSPRAVEPLQLQNEDDPEATRLVLAHSKTGASKEPPSFDVAEDCLRKSFPPAVRKSLAPGSAGAPKVEIPKQPAPKIAPPRLRPPTPAAPFAPQKVRLRPVAKDAKEPPKPPKR
jgi:hypothetical protein